MAVCSATALLKSSACFCKVTVRPYEMAELQLLCQIAQALNPMATCDVPTLMQQAKCFCGITDRPLEMVKLQLLCNISAAISGGGGGGGGIGSVTCGVGTPTSRGVVPASGCGLDIRTDGVPPGQLSSYYNGSWH